MITLSLRDIDFILETLSLPTHLQRELELLKNETVMRVSEDVADQLRDLCSDRLDTHGFDASYKLTGEGKKLEELIDKLFIG